MHLGSSILRRAVFVGLLRSRAAELLRCGIQHGFRCADASDDVLFTPACAASEEAFDQCSGSHDNCTASIAPSGSTYECDQYAATCENGVCTCTFGPHVGTTFTLVGTTYDDDVVEVAAACK